MIPDVLDVERSVRSVFRLRHIAGRRTHPSVVTTADVKLVPQAQELNDAAAFLAPTPDAVSMAMMGGPMYLLYEICILVAWLMERKRKKEADALVR